MYVCSKLYAYRNIWPNVTHEYFNLIQDSKMFKIKELVLKTNIFNVPALQYFPIAYKKRLKNTGKIADSECEVSKNDSKQLVKHCLLLGYSGSNYYGMQFQKSPKDAVTIEGILFKAMLDSNWITNASYKRPYGIKYQHASRTDKGVSAARQCCSILLPAGLDVRELNRILPDDVRLFGMKRVAHNFDARHFCRDRTYTYTLPSVAFSHYNDQVSQREYRISPDKLTHVNEILQIYKGSKNFHNFTNEKLYSDKLLWRVMKHLEVGPPFLVDDVEFCVVRIKGNSFMMHQIRKMIGLILAVIREVIDSTILNEVFSETPINCPTAPGLGLALDSLHYDDYNSKYASDGLYEKLTWEECDETVQQFREKFIQSNIVQTEIHHEHMLEWLETLLNYSYVPVVNCDAFPANHKSYI